MERSAGQSNGSEKKCIGLIQYSITFIDLLHSAILHRMFLLLNSAVLVTGATGYLAINCVQLLLNDGYNVRGTVRDLNNKHKIDPLLTMNNSQNLQLLRADLTDEHAWCDAIKGCDYVLHIASPCDTITDCSVVDIAVSGTLNVLNAIYKYHNDSVKKIVVTSSCSTVNLEFFFTSVSFIPSVLIA
ncbi:unnamed protein product [Anisakis simplex]|uniref:NAD(P)-bd_dom domain-containing protein n=1 Tax=Anisakis simplex TaxID=6269 RepID=A0A0M3J1P1_ANISI|nr:unnamed protein product [Anisakis simplex]